jgi:hypothetical protein
MRNQYLTKSRFKLALECVTQLFYTGKKQEYPDKKIDNEFLLALAKGGYQVAELAKYYFCDNPEKENITISTIDYDEALKETAKRLNNSGKVVISEAAFKFKNLFVRVDLLVREENILHVYEVKAKSIGKDDSFLNSNGTKIKTEWTEYLYDIAFQRFVIKNSLSDTNLQVKTHLLLVNKDITTNTSGLHQNFKVYSDDGRIKVIVKEGLTRNDLGTQLLIPIPTDYIIDKIENEFPVPTDLQDNLTFENFIWRAAEIYANDERVFTPIGSKCKECSFFIDGNDAADMRSGFNECWKAATGLSTLDRALVTELWNGYSGPRSYATELVNANKYFLHSIEEADIVPNNSQVSSTGLTPHLRRMEQINREKKQTSESYFDADGLKTEMANWKYPLHMIDFETSAVAIPFFKGMNPYEGIAFQFSHHTISEDWEVKHETQYLCFDPGRFPNFEFVRNLKIALSKDRGTIFRYHNHENTYLNLISRQLQNHPDSPNDRDDLMTFISEITHDSSNGVRGARDMVDLYKIVLQFYYSPLAKGSNSLKKILPAIITESDFLKEKYGRPGVYGREKEVGSLNFEDHIWIRPDANFNPYKTLPRVFENYDVEALDLLVKDMEALADGGTAMGAYNYLQFSEIPVDQRKLISDSLLRYCELDTLAMVMVLEAWRDMIEKTSNLS